MLTDFKTFYSRFYLTLCHNFRPNNIWVVVKDCWWILQECVIEFIKGCLGLFIAIIAPFWKFGKLLAQPFYLPFTIDDEGWETIFKRKRNIKK